jgi:hypothetical protein
VPAVDPPTSMRCTCTAGATARIDQMSRELGRLASFSSSKLVVTVDAFWSTTGEAPSTVTVSCIVDSSIVRSMVALKPAANC